MESVVKENGRIVVLSDYFSAFDTLECGQVFRFFKSGDVYRLISGDKSCFIRTESIALGSQPEANRTFITTEHIDYFYDYFDLFTDYSAIYGRLKGFEEFKNIDKCGIHILRGQLFETIISFIISANNNIPRIQGIIERICTNFGQNCGDYYAFPTADRLRNASVDDFRKMGAGYRSEYLFSTVKTLSSTDLLDRLVEMDYAEAAKALLSLKGVGQKVADCISLFGLHHTGSYPADTWISKADGCDAKTARKKGMERYGELAGYAQQLKFFTAREQGR